MQSAIIMTVSHKFSLIIIIIYQCWIFAFLLIGTGTNACYIEKLENVGLWDGDYNEPKQVTSKLDLCYIVNYCDLRQNYCWIS